MIVPTEDTNFDDDLHSESSDITISDDLNGKIAALEEKLKADNLKSRNLKRQLAKQTETVDKLSKSIKEMLNEDQLEQLKGSRTGAWSTETLQKALQIRAAVGKNGYEYLRQTVKYPLPSYRTLASRVQMLDMKPGFNTTLLDLLQLKTQDMAPHEKDCVLLLDEVQINKKIEFDLGLKEMTGYVSPEFQRSDRVDEVATHALVLMIKGICLPYKQTIMWFATGDGMQSEQLWAVVHKTITELFTRGLFVRAVVSDMGPAN